MCAMYYLNTGKDAHAHTMLTTKCMYMFLSLSGGGVYLSTWRVIKSAELLTYMYHQQLKELDRPYLHDMAYNAFILTWSDGSLSRRVISFGRMFISIAAF